MAVNGARTVMVYDWGGHDVVYETHTANGAGYERTYWVLPEIDRRIGFVDKYSNGTVKMFWYVTDGNGTVHAIVDGNGTIVNRYAYTSFGVIDWDYSFEGVANRYTFQGREYDAERGDYYFRNRLYFPEWGLFSGPDMNLAAGPYGEAHGMMSYVFCANDPWTYADPLGLDSVTGTFEADVIDGKPMVRRRTLEWSFWSGGRASAKEVAGSRTGWVHASEEDWIWFDQVDSGQWQSVGYGMAAARLFGSRVEDEAKGFAMFMGASAVSGVAVALAPFIVPASQYAAATAQTLLTTTRVGVALEVAAPIISGGTLVSMAVNDEFAGEMMTAHACLPPQLSPIVASFDTLYGGVRSAYRYFRWGPRGPNGVPAIVMSEMEGGGSYLMSEEKYDAYYCGKKMIGAEDGQFMVSSKQMTKLVDLTGGDPVKLAKHLGNNWKNGDVLFRVNVANPLKYNPRLPSCGMSRVNSQYISGGFLPTGTPEFVTDRLLWYETWATRLPGGR